MKRTISGIYNPAHKLALLLLDIAAIALAFYIASRIRLLTDPDFLGIEFLGITMIFIVSLFIGGAYTSSRLGEKPKLPLNTLFVVLAATIPNLIYIYLLGPEKFTAILGRGVFPVATVCFGVFAMANRIFLNFIDKSQRQTRNVILLGDQDGFTDEEFLVNTKVTKIDSLQSSLAATGRLGAIVIHPDYVPSQYEQSKLIDYRLAGVPIFSLSDFYEFFLFRVPVEEINNDWFIRTQGFTMLHSSVAIRVKRASDLFFSILLGVISLPILLVAAILIKLTSKGPIIFSQTRVGFQGQPFKLYKLRTMRLNAEPEGAKWAQSNDERIFPFGHFLRKTRIDELPQCWNIFKGEMSLIGPRPERPEFTSQLAKEIPYYDLRHIVKPGLTGWAQVCYRYGSSTEDALRKLQFDLYYIKNYSLLLDLNILLRTIQVTMRLMGR